MQGLVASSINKKIDVEELKYRLAEGMSGKRKLDTSAASMMTSAGTIMNNTKEAIYKKMNRNSRSKSPGQGLSYSGGVGEDLIPERGSAVKFEQSISNSIATGHEPAWYRALKKNVVK